MNLWFIHESEMGKMAEITYALIDIQEVSVFYGETTGNRRQKRDLGYSMSIDNLLHMVYNIARKNHAKLLITQCESKQPKMFLVRKNRKPFRSAKRNTRTRTIGVPDRIRCM